METRLRYRLWTLLLLCFTCGWTVTKGDAEVMKTFIGTYTNGTSEGIYVADFDNTTGKFGPAKLAAKCVNPSFLTLHPHGKLLYAVGETNDYGGEASGSVHAFSIDPKTGMLTELNAQASKGGAPCHLVVDDTGKTVLVANYHGGNVASLPIKDDGRLGAANSVHQHRGSSVNPNRQEGPHAHSINLDADNRFAFAADLGVDKILVYRFDADTGTLSHDQAPVSATVEPGSGPRHFAFHPSEKYAYLINELASTVTAFTYDKPSGTLETLQTISTLPDGFDGQSSTAEVVVHPTGKFVYGSNRGHDSIAVFRVDDASGKLTSVEIEKTGGRTPRNFAVDPSGKYLLAENQTDGNVHVFAIDLNSGQLTPTGEVLEVPTPVCIKFWQP